MPPNHFESEVESFLEGSHGDRTHNKQQADHHTATPRCGTLLAWFRHPVETLFAPAWGSGTPVEIFFAPAYGSSTPVEIFFAHAHPKWLIFDHFHRAGAIFLSLKT